MEIVALSGKSVRGDGGVGVPPAQNVPECPCRAGETPAPRLTWQQELRRAIRDPADLIAALDLSPSLVEPAKRAAGAFPLFAPWPYVGRMRKGDPDDPLLRQVLPLNDELTDRPGFVADPVGDLDAALSPGLLQKYQGRALLIATGACAIHCRYCFRRHFPYSESPHSIDDWQPAIEQIAADRSIDEVILSGGDPLTLVDGHLAELVERIALVEHVMRLRIHTRLPIVIPQRVTSDLIDWLTSTRLTPIMVVHATHPQEIDAAVADAISRLVDAGISVLNQSVLLRGVNDNAAALIDLSRRLINLRASPYYLHQLDRVAGAAHFEVPIPRGRELVDAVRSELPGYAVPRYVIERAGGASKEPLAG
jgi:EF-P beta-lysylation protein EpmB